MNQHIIVTGAAGNLGRAVTKFLLENAYRVTAVIAPKDPFDFMKHERLDVHQVDLKAQAAVVELFTNIKKKDQEIAGAVFLVGGFGMGNLSETSAEDIGNMIQLNFTTAYHCAQAFINNFGNDTRALKRVVLVGARPALDPDAGQHMVAYSLSKSLVFRLAELINAGTEKNKVHASVIVPSIIDTPPNREGMPDANFKDWVKPEDIAETIGFLLSDVGRNLRESVIKIYNNS